MISLTTAQVIYASQTRLLELAEIVQASTSFKRVKDEIRIGEALIRYIRVLQSDTTLTFDEQMAICQHMITIGNLYDFPASPTITSNEIFNFSAGAQTGPQGPEGAPGRDGGGTDYNNFSVTTTGNIDTFAVTAADGAEWSYKIKSGNNLRVGRIGACWLVDGSDIESYEYSTMDIGSTSAVTLSVVYAAGEISLKATVTSGTWDINGTRYFIPNNGAGVDVSGTPLGIGQIFVGNASNEAEAKTLTGDITINTGGVAAIASGVIVNGDVSSTAGISVNKLGALTANRAVKTDTSGFLTVSTVTSAQLDYLANVTSDIQTQLDTKLGSTTGAISNIVSSNLTANRALISNASGKVAVHSAVTDVQLGYLSAVGSDVQAQLNAKQALITGAASTVTSANLTANRIVVADGTGKIASGTLDPSNILTVPTGSPKVSIKVIDIGDWNMDTTDTVSIAHGLTLSTIRSATCVVRDDSNTTHHPNGTYITSATVADLWVTSINGTTVVLGRKLGGYFDSVGFDSTSYNRGWITITYIA